jgi:hypothetical protein
MENKIVHPFGKLIAVGHITPAVTNNKKRNTVPELGHL